MLSFLTVVMKCNITSAWLLVAIILLLSVAMYDFVYNDSIGSVAVLGLAAAVMLKTIIPKHTPTFGGDIPDCTKLKSENDELLEITDALEKEMQDQESEIQTQELKIQAQELKIQTLKKSQTIQLAKNHNENEALRTQSRDDARRLESKQKELDINEEKLNIVKTNLREMETKSDKSEKAIRIKEAEIENLTENNESCIENNILKQDELEEMKEKFKDLESKLKTCESVKPKRERRGAIATLFGI